MKFRAGLDTEATDKAREFRRARSLLPFHHTVAKVKYYVVIYGAKQRISTSNSRRLADRRGNGGRGSRARRRRDAK